MSDELVKRLREIAVYIERSGYNCAPVGESAAWWSATCKQAADALAAMRWIPVADRLPKEDERVLIWFEWGLHEKRVEFGRRVNGHWRPEGANGNFDDSVNWWMQLPAAPKE